MSVNQILLGIRDAEIKNDNETAWTTNKIGGRPNWMPTCSSPPDLKCTLCSQELMLAVQLYCPLDNSLYHRTLYIFCCVNQLCWNKQESWQVIRNQHLVQEETYNKAEPIQIQSDSWLSEELEWEDDCETSNSKVLDDDISCMTKDIANLNTENESDNNSPSLNTNLIDTEGESKKVILKEQLKFIPTKCNLSFKSYYINVIEEPTTICTDKDAHIQQLLCSYHVHEGSDIELTENSIQNEAYEKDWVKHGDKLFHKFAKRVARCQNQIIRYCWNDQPLLISQVDQVLPVSCPHCKGLLVFELQLMPALVEILRLPNFDGTPVEFGTVIIMTCKQSCWKDQVGFVNECIYLQSDPDESLFVHRKQQV